MKDTSKPIMGAIIATVVILAIVLILVLVLLAELYCSLLLRRLRNRKKAAIPANYTDEQPQPQQLPNAPSLSTFYAQGVLRAPRNYLFPAVNSVEVEDMEKQVPQSPIPTTPFVPVFSQYPWPVEKQVSLPYASNSSTGLDNAEQLIYISNPIYNDEAINTRKADTPFETPDTSPSRLETGDSSPDLSTPPLTPMKDVPVNVECTCSLSLRDVRSICMTSSDTNSNNYDGVSSSSSGSPRTSPSW